jgi:hypothetical protein
MEISDDLVRLLVTERLQAAREQARRRALVPRTTRPSLRARLGTTLVALGHRLLEEGAAPQRVTP